MGDDAGVFFDIRKGFQYTVPHLHTAFTHGWDVGFIISGEPYWAFYIDGEYAQTGVDATEIVADTTYELVKTVSE